jgi:superfamily II DNA or RNA helicase
MLPRGEAKVSDDLTVPPATDLPMAVAEIAKLRAENARLRAALADSRVGRATESEVAGDPPGAVTHHSSQQEKIRLFRQLFAGRDDVFAVRWERPDGRSGYSPARVWRASPPDRTGDARRPDLPLTDEVIHDHLTGRRIVGVYPLLTDETCRFLAVDFDKSGWQRDMEAFVQASDERRIPVAVERSRSGEGGHAWIFFTQPVVASQARRLGCALLTRALEVRHQLGLRSYDRLFPNQDTLPKGGYGNLIALPLQRGARLHGNTVFLHRGTLEPYADQWRFLSSIDRVSPEEVDAAVRDATRAGAVIGVPLSNADGDEAEDPWVNPVVIRRPEKPITDPLPARIRIIQANLLYVEKDGLPSVLLHRLARLGAFQNPEFYEAQALRLSTFGKPRVVDCSEDHPRHLALPRGCLEDLLTLLQRYGTWPEVTDERYAGEELDVAFQGQLEPDQRRAASALLGHDTGVLCAPTAFGKTVIAAWLVAARRTNTLVLVHRRHLLDQWRERLSTFLEVPPKTIGQIGAGRNRPTFCLDVALLQSLGRHGEVTENVTRYGQIIVDECHHIPAFSFERVLKGVKAKYVVGLTATPMRKDGHHPIVVMQCGPIRHRVSARDHAKTRPFDHRVIVRPTSFQVSENGGRTGIQALYRQLAQDDERTEQICRDVVAAVREGRSPLVLTERTDHLATLVARIEGHVSTVIVLRGAMGARQRRAAHAALTSVPYAHERVVVATGRYIGEGFDDSRLDTLFLSMPVSWKGTIQQYAGRLHRLHASKETVVIHDYVDVHVPMLLRMHEKRLRGYRAIGYTVDQSHAASPPA